MDLCLGVYQRNTHLGQPEAGTTGHGGIVPTRKICGCKIDKVAATQCRRLLRKQQPLSP